MNLESYIYLPHHLAKGEAATKYGPATEIPVVVLVWVGDETIVKRFRAETAEKEAKANFNFFVGNNFVSQNNKRISLPSVFRFASAIYEGMSA